MGYVCYGPLRWRIYSVVYNLLGDEMSDKYAERARETDWGHELWPPQAKKHECVLCGRLYENDPLTFTSQACPVKIARALEQAALEARNEAYQEILGKILDLAKLSPGRAAAYNRLATRIRTMEKQK